MKTKIKKISQKIITIALMVVCLTYLDKFLIHSELPVWGIALMTTFYYLFLDKHVRGSMDHMFQIQKEEDKKEKK